MKAIFYILFIFLLLSGGSSKSFANNSSNNNFIKLTDKISKSRPIKYNNKNPNSIILHDTEIDLEEECDQIHETTNNNPKKLIFDNYLFSNRFQSVDITRNSLHCLNKINSPLCCGVSIPIYISLQVLRI